MLVLAVGVQAASLELFVALINRLNGERPAAARYGDDERTEKLLEAIANASSHLHVEAMKEYNAVGANQRFRTAGGTTR